MSCNSSVVAICLWRHKMFSPHPLMFAADSLFAISPASQYTLLLGLICQYLFSSFIIPFYLKKMDQIYAREISFWSVILCPRYSNLKLILFTKINCKRTDLRQNNVQLLQAERAFVNISRCHLEIIIFIQIRPLRTGLVKCFVIKMNYSLYNKTVWLNVQSTGTSLQVFRGVGRRNIDLLFLAFCILSKMF